MSLSTKNATEIASKNKDRNNGSQDGFLELDEPLRKPSKRFSSSGRRIDIRRNSHDDSRSSIDNTNSGGVSNEPDQILLSSQSDHLSFSYDFENNIVLDESDDCYSDNIDKSSIDGRTEGINTNYRQGKSARWDLNNQLDVSNHGSSMASEDDFRMTVRRPEDVDGTGYLSDEEGNSSQYNSDIEIDLEHDTDDYFRMRRLLDGGDEDDNDDSHVSIINSKYLFSHFF